MSVLYISDLDGTLFNSEKNISDYTAEVLNACISKGMRFAVATARMPYGCDYRLKKIHMNIPGILSNGVFLYDFQKEKILEAEWIEKTGVNAVIEVFEKNKIPCFVYTYSDMGISIYYNSRILEKQTQYYSVRAQEACEKIQFVENIKKEIQNQKVIYISYSGKKEEIEPLCEQLRLIEEVRYSSYLNVYNDIYCLEIFSKNASKKNALLKLKNIEQCEEVVVFGDNLNDLSMIEIAK